MTMTKKAFAFCGIVVAAVWCATAQAQNFGVSVGQSSLIKTLDYSDSFTITDQGGLPDRPDRVFGLAGTDYGIPEANGVTGEGQYVENAYGNPARMWTDYMWSITTDANVWDPDLIYPGDSGAGSDTGITQTGYTLDSNFGIEYGLRDRFVVQFDAVAVPDRIDITIGNVRDSFSNPANLTLFIRPQGSPYGDVSLYNGGIGEMPTELTSPVVFFNEWHNYAALFDFTTRTIEVYVDEVSLGVIDVNAVDLRLADLTLSSAVVNVGACTLGMGANPLLWTDNFQVGSPDVAPLPVIGDTNGDRVVDELDAAKLAENWLLTVGNGAQDGDFNLDGKVNDLDASILAAHWAYSGSSTAAVPEPSVLALALAGLIGFRFLRKRR